MSSASTDRIVVFEESKRRALNSFTDLKEFKTVMGEFAELLIHEETTLIVAASTGHNRVALFEAFQKIYPNAPGPEYMFREGPSAAALAL